MGGMISGYDERGHRVGSAVLVQLLVEDGVRRLHRAQTVAVHVEVVLRVDEAYVPGVSHVYRETRRRRDAPRRR